MTPNAAALAFAAATFLLFAPAAIQAQEPVPDEPKAFTAAQEQPPAPTEPVAAAVPAAAAAPEAAPAPEAAAPKAPGANYHGAGGPFAGAILLIPRTNAPLVLMTTGGYGYTYWLDGRLRLGGGGQGTVLSTQTDGRTGSIGWGGITLGFEPSTLERWEFPLAVALGGGRVSLERVRSDGLIERDEATFFAVQGSAAVEFRPLRTVKLSLTFSWLGAIHNGLAAQALEASLRLVFLIPRLGH